ncbi:MAG: DUF4189 domain-containing protein [Proteobacteria bacterium]|nr:DUF4189 domain-containing protein [Pseudomonadota bacterium]
MKLQLRGFLLAATIALAPTHVMAWGAIAVDDGKGRSADDVGYGYVVGANTEKEANSGALKQCRAKNKSCKVVIAFETCGAYAVSGNRWGTGEGVTKGAARRIALANCGNEACKVVAAECDEE